MAGDTPSQRLDLQSSTGLGRYLQGVQHVGVTVDDWAKSLELYIDVLGGKPAIQGAGFYGDVLHSTLFQKEELDAKVQGVAPHALGVPDLRTGQQEALDVVFISRWQHRGGIDPFPGRQTQSQRTQYVSQAPVGGGVRQRRTHPLPRQR